MAIGFIGDPVPPSTAKGAAVNKKDQRFLALAASLRASKSQLSSIGVPIAVITAWCMGINPPSTPEGSTSEAKSLPRIDTSCFLNQGRQLASNPAEPFS